MLIRRLRTLALSFVGALAIASAAESVVPAIQPATDRATAEHVAPSHTGGSLRAIDAPASVAALSGGQPTISQNPGGRSTGFDFRNPSFGSIDGPDSLFGVRRRGVDPAAGFFGPTHTQHHRFLRIGAISAFTTSLPPPPQA